MSVTFRTNSEIFQQHLVNCVNAICALRQQLHDLTDEATRHSLETSIIKLSTRLDTLIETQANWDLPKLDNQDIASKKFDQEFRMAEYALFAQEMQKQIALGNIQYTPSYIPTVDTEPIFPSKPTRKPRKKRK